MKQSKLLMGAFISISLIVTAGLIWIACHFVDSLHNNVQATKSIRRQEETAFHERGKVDPIANEFSSQIDSMSDTNVFRAKLSTSELSGSEVFYEKGLEASNARQYSQAVADLTRVLSMIEEESKTRKTWFADSKHRDKTMYLALTYELRAFCYLHQKQFRAAILDLDKAIEKRPGYGANYVNRGKAHILLGETALGQKDLAHARTLPVTIEEISTEHTLDDLAGRD